MLIMTNYFNNISEVHSEPSIESDDLTYKLVILIFHSDLVKLIHSFLKHKTFQVRVQSFILEIKRVCTGRVNTFQSSHG